MSELLKLVRECKELRVLALTTDDTVNIARYEHKFWTLMHKHGDQILDIVDGALSAQEEE